MAYKDDIKFDVRLSAREVGLLFLMCEYTVREANWNGIKGVNIDCTKALAKRLGKYVKAMNTQYWKVDVDVLDGIKYIDKP